MTRSVRRILIAAALLLVVIVLALSSAGVRRYLRHSAAYSGLVDGLRSDLGKLRTRQDKRQAASDIETYVRAHSIRKLQLGAGDSRPAGWLNTDIFAGDGLVYLDATKPFPIENGTFHYIFSEHVIEHLGYDGAMAMLAESYRVLAPSGKIRIATPNLLQFVALFQGEKTEQMRDYIRGKLAWHQWPTHPTAECVILNLQLSSFGHRFVFDPETLKAALARTGFESIQQFTVGESDDPELRGLESRETLAEVARVNEYETMIFQAVKPADPAGGH